MKIGVIGTGSVGRAVATRLVELGHDVTIGTRDPSAKSGDWPAPLATFAGAAAGAELIVNATAGEASVAALRAAGPENLAGKVLLDISNALDHYAGPPPRVSNLDGGSMGEFIQAEFPEARVVKSLNTMNNPLMVEPAQLAAGEHTVFVSGNDAAAKQTVSELLRSFGHTDIIDLGDIKTARGPEQLVTLWISLMQTLGTPTFQFKVVR